MVEYFTKLARKDYHTLAGAALMLSVFSFLSQFLGFFRDRLLSTIIGPSRTLDIYITAFRVPDFLYVSLAALVSVTVLVPFFSNLARKEGGDGEIKKIVASVFTVFTIAIGISTIALYFLMPKIAPLLAPGFDAASIHELTRISRVMLLSPLILGFSNFIGSLTQYKKLFFTYALAPVLYNIGILFGILFFYRSHGLLGLAWGVVLGGVLHLLIQLPSMKAVNIPLTFTKVINMRVVRSIFLTSLPRTLTLALSSINLLVLFALGSKLVPGSISLFNFSLNIATVPSMLVGISFAVAAFPTLSILFVEKRGEEFSIYFSKAIANILFWVMPLSALFIVLRAHIVRVVIGSANLTWSDTKIAAALVLILTSAGILQALIPLFTRGYYARGYTWRPLVYLLLGSIITIVFAAVSLPAHGVGATPSWIVSLLRLKDVSHPEVIFLSFGYLFGLVFSLVTMWYDFDRISKTNVRMLGERLSSNHLLPPSLLDSLRTPCSTSRQTFLKQSDYSESYSTHSSPAVSVSLSADLHSTL
jgi:putative peptidoglycan lipid II flippase